MPAVLDPQEQLGTGWGDGGFVRIRYNQPDILLDTSWPFYSDVPLISRRGTPT